MPSKTPDNQDGQRGTRDIARDTGEDTCQAAARPSSSELLRARNIPAFDLGRARTDVRGWPVYSRDGELVGVVSSLFVDMRTKAIRYVGVSLNTSKRAIAREILIPVGWIRRPDDRQVVVASALSYAQIMAAPRLSNRPVTRADEHATLTVFGVQPSTSAGAHDLYDSPLFDEWRLFGGPGSRAALG